MGEGEPVNAGDSRNPDGTFKPGVSGNPAGRPPGTISIKDKVRQYLEEHPEAMDDIVKHFIETNRELMWQMLEGKPPQAIDHTSKGEALPSPIYGGQSTIPVPEHDSD